MTRNEILNEVLKYLHRADPGYIYLGQICEEIGVPDKQVYEICDALISEDLAKGLDPKTRMSITDHGRQVINVGGWLKICAHQEEQVAKNIAREELEDKKLANEAFISEWQVKTRWWPHIISLISLIVAVTALAMQLWKSEPTEKKLELPTPAEQVEISSSKVPIEADQSLHPDTLK